ncbi:MAG TPA: RluA family pseudouridine synthase [Vicinamibacterales bacterium]
MSEPLTHLEFQVPASESGARLDQFLVGVVPDHSRSQIQRLIKDGLVRLAGRPARPNTAVRHGDRIFVDFPAPKDAKPASQPLPIDIVYEDGDLVVVNKTAGMVVHPAAGHADGTLVNALLHHIEDLSGIGGERRPGIVHRLDRGTSGLMVVAKNDAAHTELTRQFHDREVEKEYIALVWGLVQAGRRIDAPIGRDPVHRQKMSARARRARSAVTRVTRAERLRGVTLLHVAIATGRTHQIRVHLSAIGHPIVGDRLYGGTRRHMPGDLRALKHLERPFLHAARLVFTHPSDGRRMEFSSPLPNDLQAVLDELHADQDAGNDS